MIICITAVFSTDIVFHSSRYHRFVSLQTLAPVKMADVLQPDSNSLQIPSEMHTQTLTRTHINTSLLLQSCPNDSLLLLYLLDRGHADLSMSFSHLGILHTSHSSGIPTIPFHSITIITFWSREVKCVYIWPNRLTSTVKNEVFSAVTQQIQFQHVSISSWWQFRTTSFLMIRVFP